MSGAVRLAGVLERQLGHSVDSAGLRRLRERLAASAPSRALESLVDELESSSLESPVWRELLAEHLVPKTSFFRHPDQLEDVRPLIRPRGGRVRVWSAGCSVGMEAYTLAIWLRELSPEVLGSDVSPALVEQARKGRYERPPLEEVPHAERRFLEPGEAGVVQVPRAIRELVRFEVLNLADPRVSYPWPDDATGWDLILCRNVLIYFEEGVRAQVLGRLAQRLAPGGVLLLSPVERAHCPELTLVPMGEHFAYRREGGGARLRPEVAPRAEPLPAPAPPPEPLPAPKPAPTPVAPAPLPKPVAAELTGALRAAQEDVPRARARLEKATALADLDPFAHWEIARAYRSLGLLGEAEAALRRVLALQEDLWEASFQLAGVLFRGRRFQSAGRTYDRTLRLLAEAPDDHRYRHEVEAVCRRRARECRVRHEVTPLEEGT